MRVPKSELGVWWPGEDQLHWSSRRLCRSQHSLVQGVCVILALVYYLLVIYSWLIVARGLLSWTTPRYGSGLYRLQAVLIRVTEPYLALFRRRLRPARLGSVGLDWSFLVALLVLFGAIEVIGRL